LKYKICTDIEVCHTGAHPLCSASSSKDYTQISQHVTDVGQMSGLLICQRLSPTRLIKVLHPTRHKIGHFGDVLPSQFLGLLLKN